MFTSYGETSGFSALNNEELMLVNGGKGGGGGSGGGGSTPTKSTTPTTNTKSYTPTYTPTPAPKAKDGITVNKIADTIPYGVSIKDGNVTVKAGLGATPSGIGGVSVTVSLPSSSKKK
jgi:hypothetical protein